MASYSTWDKLVGRYPAMKGPTRGQTNVNDHWLSQASAEVDARLGRHYTIPFSPVPTLIEDIVIDLAYYKMNIGRKSVAALKKYIDERLNGLINGSLTLGGYSPARDAVLVSAPYETAFGFDDSANWDIDCDLSRYYGTDISVPAAPSAPELIDTSEDPITDDSNNPLEESDGDNITT